MKRVLVLCYSQTGDVRRMAETLTSPLIEAGVKLVWEELRPRVVYPSPWRSIHKFFNVMPECILQDPPEIEPPKFDPDQRFDLVIVAYQVWFLAPSLPVQGFFRSAHASVLQGAKVLTLSVSRDSWHNASETMKALLADADANHTDNVVVTYQGPPLATFITTPRAVLFGKRNRLFGIFPAAVVSPDDVDRVERLGHALVRKLDLLDKPGGASLLRGEDAVQVNRHYVVPELVGWYVFRFWARLIRGSGRIWSGLRHMGVFLFSIFLVFMIITGIPLVFLGELLIGPWFRRRISAYIARLKEPTGSPADEPAPVPAGALRQSGHA